MKKYIQLRLKRGFSLSSLGMNEARILFDLCVGSIGLLSAWAFSVLFPPHFSLRYSQRWAALALPLIMVMLNGVFGVYTSLRSAPGWRKALTLLGSISCSCLLASTLVRNGEFVVLWGLLVYGPLTLARLLLALPHSRQRSLTTFTVNRLGPVVVIGGAGYIGSHTVDLLLKQGFAVRVLDRLMYGSDSLAEFAGHRNFELIEGDATDLGKLAAAVNHASAVIHLAGLVGDPACAIDEGFTRHANVVATRMAADVARALGAYRFIFASSCSVYGATDKEVDEESPLNPVSLYALTKIDSERELLSSVQDDFLVTVLRFATVFGHSRRPRFDLVGNLFTAQALTDGVITVFGPNQWRPFIHVADLARAIVATLTADPAMVRGQIFNVGDKRLNMTILQLAEAVKSVVSTRREVTVFVREDMQDRRNYAVSFDKISSVLGFRAQRNVPGAIEEMVQHFEAGDYQSYRQEVYSNVAMTKRALSSFQDPAEMARLYAPLSPRDPRRADRTGTAGGGRLAPAGVQR